MLRLGAQEPGGWSCWPQTQVAKVPQSLPYPQPSHEPRPPYPTPAQAPVTQSQELCGNNNNNNNATPKRHAKNASPKNAPAK